MFACRVKLEGKIVTHQPETTPSVDQVSEGLRSVEHTK